MTAPRIFTPEYYARMRALEQSGWWNAAMRAVARDLLTDAELAPSGRLLDAGCGSGQTMTWFRSQWPAWRTVGCDVARDGLVAAHDAGEQAVACASVLDLPYEDGDFDAAITLDVIQHLPLDGGDRRALREIRRVLRPGGILFLRTNAQAFPPTADDAAASFHRYEPGELREKLTDAGFGVLRLSRLNALLGLAEIPRELRAARRPAGGSYHGIMAEPRAESPLPRALKVAWLGVEGALVRAGVRLPIGRTIVAVCRAT